jgi:hypothetical protein
MPGSSRLHRQHRREDGNNETANLWVEPAEPHPGFHEKDLVENALHRQVCAGKMTLADAQHLIATDWVSVYHAMVGQ